MDRWCVVSTVGTSLLNNWAREYDPSLNGLLRNIANEREKDLDAQTRNKVSALTNQVLSAAAVANPDQLKKMSAELNGLLSLYGNRLFSPERRALDTHYLIATDTYLGATCSDLLALILEQLGFGSVLQPPFTGLTTKSYQAFSGGISQLVEWCGRELPPHQNSNSHVIFNLVGSFKSLQGYMNTLGMFYANEIIYIFEAEDAELIRIPRLPVMLNEVEELRSNLPELGLLAHGMRLDHHRTRNIPEAFLTPDGPNGYRLGEWGKVVWDTHGKELLASTELLSLPHLEYTPSFRGDHRALAPSDKALVQETLLKAAVAIETDGVRGLTEHGGLQYSTLNKSKGSEQPIDYFRVNRDIRITCTRQRSKLRLRRVGPHDQVLAKP